MGDTGQVTSDAAEVYEEFFLPALFSEWPPRLIEAARLKRGARVLDVACGTGVLTVEAAKAISPTGAAVGVDLNPGMLAIARRKAPRLDWREAPAEDLPFGSADFDAVLSQFGLMFFQDRQAAIREMWRVLRPGGRLVIAVWGTLEQAVGYLAATRLLARLFGEEIAALLRAPYTLGDPSVLEALLVESGVEKPDIAHLEGEARFPSIRSWMHTDVRGWTLSGRLDDEQFEILVREAEHELSRFVTPQGPVRFDHPALVATARKP